MSERLFDRIGGDELRAVITDFYDRLFADVMIGFLFQGKNKRTLIQREWELIARLLGADVPYTGRPMRVAHAQVPILGGHFERRLQILRHTLAGHAVEADIQNAWIRHSLALRSQVTGDQGSECKDTRMAHAEPPPAEDKPVKLGRR